MWNWTRIKDSSPTGSVSRREAGEQGALSPSLSHCEFSGSEVDSVICPLKVLQWIHRALGIETYIPAPLVLPPLASSCTTDPSVSAPQPHPVSFGPSYPSSVLRPLPRPLFLDNTLTLTLRITALLHVPGGSLLRAPGPASAHSHSVTRFSLVIVTALHSYLSCLTLWLNLPSNGL